MRVLEEDVEEILGPDANDLAKYKVLLGKKNGVKGVSFIIGNIAPGGGTERHKHEHEEELYYIIEGSGLWKIGDEEFLGKPGAALYVPADTEHSMVNNGSERLKMILLHSPASL
jgi:mannose-6-phosphate isomerase-like protein (cupin superfamily)